MSDPYQIINADVLEGLSRLPDESVHCVVTSPPYWNLRNYGIEGQIGLEKTPEEYIEKMTAVFREVRRVLRSDGTCWINMGDTYASGCDGWRPGNTHKNGGNSNRNGTPTPPGLKPKDLVGVPWRLAFALQQPYYTGKIRNEHDRVWLAAMVESEGCLFIHKRKAGQSNGQGYDRVNASYGAGLEVASTDRVVVEKCMAITGLGSVCQQSPEQNGRRKQTIYRWNLRSNVCRDVIKELYPHFIAKHHEARILLGCPSSGPDAEKAHKSLKALHQGGVATIDFQAPKTLFEPGWFLRQDIIWKKSNPMPESVTDRCTKAHEYIFLMTRAARYYYDADAIREPHDTKNGTAGSTWEARKAAGHPMHYGHDAKAQASMYLGQHPNGRNRRSVWTVATQPYPEAHFATFPPRLIEPCILAGSPEGGIVLDPFNGSGTTGQVALTFNRRYIGIEINPEYVTLTHKRLSPLLNDMFISQQPTS